MSKNTIGYGLLIIGILIIAGALSADVLGLGSGSNAIGWKQWLGAGVGLVVAAVGAYLSLLRK